ncbi:unnamed protein product [Trifolium pratense]|uniref:Uncharacterized protein n=1 Tax=Trifolium pratense TaxID=57577 RepID=A0ACB0LUK4_TRIPR|nr:unnamed protein product [Trifolium pratense]
MLCDGFKNVPNLVLRDVTPLSLGMNTTGDMEFFITKNTSIPFKKTEIFGTVIDNQSGAKIRVCEGERARASDNNLLGSFELFGPPRARRGHPVDVCFTIDENGILIVSAYEKSTGSRNSNTITNDKERLSSQEIKKMIREGENYRVEDEKFLRKANVMNALDSCVYKIKNALVKKEVKVKLSSKEKDQIDRAITKAINLLDSAQQREIDVLENHLEELESSIIQQIIGRYV